MAAIRVLLYSEGYTIKGVQRILKEQGARAVVTASSAPRGAAQPPGSPVRTEPPPPPHAAAPPETPGRLGTERRHRQQATLLSTRDRDRLESILAELGECARLLA